MLRWSLDIVLAWRVRGGVEQLPFACSAVEGCSGLLVSVVGARVSNELIVHSVGAVAGLCIEVAVGAAGRGEATGATVAESSTDTAVATATLRVVVVGTSADRVFGGQEGVDRRTSA